MSNWKINVKDILWVLSIPFGIVLLSGAFLDSLSNIIEWINPKFSFWGTIIATTLLIIYMTLEKKGTIFYGRFKVVASKTKFRIYFGVLITLLLPRLFDVELLSEEVIQSADYSNDIFRDSSSLKILILRFNDYITKDDTYAIGRAIEENIQVLSYQDDIDIDVKYLSEFTTPTSFDSVQLIQDFTEADIIIYGLSRNEDVECNDASICFRYNISSNLIPNSVSEAYEITRTKHDLNYFSIPISEIESAGIPLQNQFFHRWLHSLSLIKQGRTNNGLILLDEIANDTSLTVYSRYSRYIDLGHFNFQVGNYDDALEAYYNAYLLAPLRPESKNFAAIVCLNQKDTLRAEQFLVTSLLVEPNAFAYLYLGAIQNEYYKNTDLYWTYLYHGLAVADKSPRLTKGQLLGELAMAHLDKMNIDSAKIYAEKSLDLAGEIVKPYLILADCYTYEKEFESALAYAEQAIKLGENGYYPYSIKGGSLYELGRYNEALVSLKKSISIFANQPELYYMIAAIYIQQENFHQVKNYLEQAIVHGKNEPHVQEMLSLAKQLIGEVELENDIE